MVQLLRSATAALICQILRFPRLSYSVNRVLMLAPALHQRLFRLAQESGIDTGLVRRAHPEEAFQPGNTRRRYLTRRGREIAADLLAASQVEGRRNTP